MNFKFNKKAKRLISGFVAAATAITMLPAIPAMAEELGRYPFTLFAGSSSEGAITTTASNFGVNGNVATNGTISAAGNMNINGTKTENAGLDMIYIFDKIDSKYFSGDNVEEHTEDYVLDELNINISEPTEVLGEAELTGNININTALKAFKDVTLNGEVKNTNDSVIYSKYGDIVIDSTNVNLNGLVYAPFGSVEVKAMNLNLNNVVIIADSIVFDCPNVNANYSTNAADFVGTVSEPLNIPKDEWQYMKDENENGLPDFFENFENWSKLADSDGDGLPDSIEEYLGSDPNNIDTDGDGLNDFFEVFGTYTDPTKADTDENGVNDGDEDFDEDGLTNLEEFENETNPYIADTDSDGLSDGDEVKVYGTNPLVADTDGDGLDDGDEIVLGTNPLVQDTDGDGIIDSKEKFQQTFTHKVRNDDCAVTEVIVDMECTGNINRTTSVESVMNTDILCTDVVGLVGEPFEIETDSEFDKATLTFKIDKDKLGEIPFDNLLFLWYNEEDNEFIELETTLDADSSTASITTTHFSKYMVVDKKAWFDAWSIQFNYNPSSDGSHYEPGVIYPTVKYNTVLAIDCSGSMSWNDPKNQRTDAAKRFIEYMHTNDKTAIVLFTGSAQLAATMTNDANTLTNALSRVYSNGGTDFSAAINKAISAFDEKDINAPYVNNRIILLSDGEDGGSRGALNKALEICDNKHKNIKIFTVGFGSASDYLMEYIASATGGEYFKALSADDLIDIFVEIGYSGDFDMTDTDDDGLPDAVEAAGIRLQNGKIIYDCDPTDYDTDGDGLMDGEEINPNPQRHQVPTFVTDPSFVGPPAPKYEYYFKAYSSPVFADSDYDGIDDDEDYLPYNNTFTGKVTDEYASYDVKFNVDYRNFFSGNEKFNQQLSILGAVFANLAYVDTSIDIDTGVNSNLKGLYSLQELYGLFGIDDVKDYKLADYFQDDDISEMIIGHNKVAFNNDKKDIIIVSVRGTDATIEEWSSDFDVGADTDAYWDRDNPYWRNKENHKGFDVAANRLFDLIDSYVKSYVDSDMQKAIYIVGHSRGAAIANILGTLFEDLPEYESFVYTFATPNTTTNKNYAKYKTIFNCCNSDDLVTYLPLLDLQSVLGLDLDIDWGFRDYGTTYNISIRDNYERDWEKLTGILDYNYNGHLVAALKALGSLVESREELYEYTDDLDTIYMYTNDIYDGQSRIDVYGERLARYCQIISSEISGYEQIDTTHYAPEQAVYNVRVKQTPAFLMMVLSDITASKCHSQSNGRDFIVDYNRSGHDEGTVYFFGFVPFSIGFNVAPRYYDALSEFCKSGADTKKIANFFRMGGMVNAHMPTTYYLLATKC